MSRNSERAGFTLVELLAALMIGLLAVIAGRQVVGTLTDQADRVTAIAADLDRVGNGEHLLRVLLANLVDGSDSAPRFTGSRARSAFSSWCAAPAGWLELCRVTLVVAPADSAGAQDVLAALLSTGEALPLMIGPAPIRILYLVESSNGGTWRETWTSLSPPVAVGIVVAPDTIVVRIGERG